MYFYAFGVFSKHFDFVIHPWYYTYLQFLWLKSNNLSYKYTTLFLPWPVNKTLELFLVFSYYRLNIANPKSPMPINLKHFECWCYATKRKFHTWAHVTKVLSKCTPTRNLVQNSLQVIL
jgi:hypothetical protein